MMGLATPCLVITARAFAPSVADTMLRGVNEHESTRPEPSLASSFFTGGGWVVAGFVALAGLLRDLNTGIRGLGLLGLSAAGALGVAGVQWGQRRATVRARVTALVGALVVVSVVVGPVLVDAERSGHKRTWDEQARAAQARVDHLRIGMTEEEADSRFGDPTGRFAAPKNPYGVTTEITYVDKMLLMQLLLDGTRSVVYYAVTTRDRDLRINSHVGLCNIVGSGNAVHLETSALVLNRTTIADTGCVARDSEIMAVPGASYFNIAFAWGGGHASNWEYDAMGMNVFANRYARGRPIGRTAGQGRAIAHLRNALNSEAAVADLGPSDHERACEKDLAANSVGSVPRAWLASGCKAYKWLPDEAGVVGSKEWEEFSKEATVDTFAVTRPLLFDVNAHIFYALWDLGPSDLSMP